MQNRHLIIKSIQDLQLGPTLFTAALFSPLIMCVPFFVAVVFQCVWCSLLRRIFKTNVVSLSILLDKMKKHCIVICHEIGAFSTHTILWVNSAGSFVNLVVTVILGFPDVWIKKWYTMSGQGCIFNSFFISKHIQQQQHTHTSFSH